MNSINDKYKVYNQIKRVGIKMEKSKSRIFIIIILVVLLTLCLVFGIYGFINKDKYNDNKNITNIDEKVDNKKEIDKKNNDEAQVNEDITSTKTEDDVSSTEDEDYNYEDEDFDFEDEDYSVLVNYCNKKDCELYKDNNVLINVKSIIKKEDEYSCDIYFNNKLSYRIKDCGDSLNLEKINDGFLIKVASEGFFSYFYLFDKDGNFIIDFSEEMKKNKNQHVTVSISNNELIMSISKLTSLDDGDVDLIKDSYCELKAKPTDTFETTNYYKINANKLEIYKVENITWEEAYKCENGESENCGDITKVKCKNN